MGAIVCPRWGTLAALALALASCASGRAARRARASGHLDQSDVAALARLWRGEHAGCVPAQGAAGARSAGLTCSVAGWDEVVLRPDAGGYALLASTSDESRCSLPRFATEPRRLDSAQAQILSMVTVVPDDDLFPAACLSLGVYYDRQLCELTLYPRSAPRDGKAASELERAGCSRY